MARYASIVCALVIAVLVGCLSKEPAKTSGSLSAHHAREAIALVNQFYETLSGEAPADGWPDLFACDYLSTPASFDARAALDSKWTFVRSNAWLFVTSAHRGHPRSPIDFFRQSAKSVCFFNVQPESRDYTHAILFVTVSGIVSDRTTPYAAWKDVAFPIEWSENGRPSILFTDIRINGVVLDSFLLGESPVDWDVNRRLWGPPHD